MVPFKIAFGLVIILLLTQTECRRREKKNRKTKKVDYLRELTLTTNDFKLKVSILKYLPMNDMDYKCYFSGIGWSKG